MERVLNLLQDASPDEIRAGDYEETHYYKYNAMSRSLRQEIPSLGLAGTYGEDQHLELFVLSRS